MHTFFALQLKGMTPFFAGIFRVTTIVKILREGKKARSNFSKDEKMNGGNQNGAFWVVWLMLQWHEFLPLRPKLCGGVSVSAKSVSRMENGVPGCFQ